MKNGEHRSLPKAMQPGWDQEAIWFQVLEFWCLSAPSDLTGLEDFLSERPDGISLV